MVGLHCRSDERLDCQQTSCSFQRTGKQTDHFRLGCRSWRYRPMLVHCWQKRTRPLRHGYRKVQQSAIHLLDRQSGCSGTDSYRKILQCRMAKHKYLVVLQSVVHRTDHRSRQTQMQTDRGPGCQPLSQNPSRNLTDRPWAMDSLSRLPQQHQHDLHHSEDSSRSLQSCDNHILLIHTSSPRHGMVQHLHCPPCVHLHDHPYLRDGPYVVVAASWLVARTQSHLRIPSSPRLVQRSWLEKSIGNTLFSFGSWRSHMKGKSSLLDVGGSCLVGTVSRSLQHGQELCWKRVTLR